MTQFLTPLMLRVLILHISGETDSLKSTTKGKFFWEIFHGKFIYSLEIAEEILFVFCFDV